MNESGNIVVTGAGGLLGGAVAEVFALHDYDFTALDRNVLDVTNAEACRRIIGELEPLAVINCAAYTKVDQAEDEEDKAAAVNIGGAENVARAAAEVGAKVVYFSTDFVFDGTKEKPYNEDDPPAPINAYGRTKWAGETATRKANPDHAIIRTAWLYGPHGPNFIETILHLARERDELTVVDDQIGSPTYSLDLAAALPMIIQLDLKGTFNLVNAGQTSWFGLAQKALELENIEVRLRAIPSARLDRKAQRPAMSVLDCERMREHGIGLRPWDEALAAYLERRSRA